MKIKEASGLTLIIIGLALAIYGFVNVKTTITNLGIAGVFLGLIVLTFKSNDYVKAESVHAIMEPYRRVFSTFADNLYLEGNAIFIPPYENLPEGGLFVPLHEKFELDLARLDEGIVFLTDVPNDRAMGLFLGPFGGSLVEKFEEHFEGPLDGAGSGTVESVTGSVLRYLELADRVYIEENDDGFRIVIRPTIRCRPRNCEKTPCPICASVLLALAKGTNQVLAVESVEEKDYGIEVTARKLGGVEKWM
ncbi:hypothetical protein [Thermococcus sp. 21S9]|uniref:hypothetical protein n=1 Tax=Thermococcus sp. 21S9 TaxID=1638223 RepID=UPI00143AB5FE|nr:hypothetical protein [Thermococcus sp. 21S9]NJE54582.1 hypothetical protein [Thermococcus sp. 21S9]